MSSHTPPSPDGASTEDIDLQQLSGYDARLAKANLLKLLRHMPSTLATVFRLAWRAAPKPTCWLIAAELLTAVMTGVGLLGGAQVIAPLVAGGPISDRLVQALPAVALVAAALMVRGLAETVAAEAQARLTPRVRQHAEGVLNEAAVHAELAAYDDADWHEALARSRERAIPFLDLAITTLVQMVSAVAGLLAIGGVLGVLHPLLLPLLLVSVLPQARAALKVAQLGYDGMFRFAVLRRRQQVLADLMTERSAAAEIRALTAQPFLMTRFRELGEEVRREEQQVEVRQARSMALGRALGGAATALTFGALILLLQGGQIPLASAGAAAIALSTSRQSLAHVILTVNRLHEYGLYLKDFEWFIAETTRRSLRRTGESAPGSFDRIDVQGLTFRYPCTEAEAVQDVTFTVERGEVVALVGENGSGKSTIAKLMAGLYEPSVGTIRWDGTVSAAWDEDSIHQRVALIPQEAVRWPFDAATNIRLGRPERCDPDRSGIIDAARQAGVHNVLCRLPRGYDSMLSREFTDGCELSGGQWQALSIARGIYRDAPLLICDEPTAALDPRAEHLIYEALRSLTDSNGRRRSTLLITHRLASVRMADRVLVLQQGRLVEQGTHEELMSLGGLYAELFTMQAAGYQG